MSATELLADLARLGIEVIAHGDRLRYGPRSAMTPDLAERLRTHKAELLAILRPAVAETVAERPAAVPEPIWEEDYIDPPDPCSECGTLELWQTLAGNWRCLLCDPPTTARRLAELAERIRQREAGSRTTGRINQ